MKRCVNAFFRGINAASAVPCSVV